MPKTEGPDLFDKMFKGVAISRISPGVYVGPCDHSEYHSISLYIDGFFFRLEPATFVQEIGLSDKCFVSFRYSKDEHWVLGEPFFKNYYSVFDDMWGTVALATSIEFPNSTIIPAEQPITDLGRYPEETDNNPEPQPSQP
mmetsp:Transcript_2009/g.2997  ORF Transcript_2009/g.2997 Transcript_2009/m.2997 type:complete len:140 (+) Transcript_2009:923-1342(+)